MKLRNAIDSAHGADPKRSLEELATLQKSGPYLTLAVNSSAMTVGQIVTSKTSDATRKRRVTIVMFDLRQANMAISEKIGAIGDSSGLPVPAESQNWRNFALRRGSNNKEIEK